MGDTSELTAAKVRETDFLALSRRRSWVRIPYQQHQPHEEAPEGYSFRGSSIAGPAVC